MRREPHITGTLAGLALAILAVVGASLGPAPPAPEAPEAPILPVAAPRHVDLELPRELRGAWVPTVANILWPSKPGLSERAQRDELARIVSVAADTGLNAIFFQVRPEADALYRSPIEPWSSFLTGRQGEDPGWDPLATLLRLAHDRNVEIHAWLNPYRAASDASRGRAGDHVSLRRPRLVHRYGGLLWMDPGVPEVREQLVSVVRDLARRYPLDGLHFDDYFYPYPDGKKPFPDDPSWKAHGRGHTDRGAWRRDNVNRAVEAVSAACAEERPALRFGISPFGINRPGQPEGIRGFDQYTGLNADPLHWMESGWIDYIAPQLYWPSTRQAQAYGPLAAWWETASDGKAWFFAGNFLSMFGEGPEWSLDEFRLQAELDRAHADGHIWYHLAPILEDRQGVRAWLRDDLYAEPAVTPPLRRALGRKAPPPEVARGAGGLRAHHVDLLPLRAWAIWRSTGAGWELHRLVPAGTDPLPDPGGTVAVAALSADGVLSPASVLQLD